MLKGGRDAFMRYVVKDNCIGCGLCAAICPEVFEIGPDGQSHAKNAEENEDNRDSALEAMERCPVDAIKQA